MCLFSSYRLLDFVEKGRVSLSNCKFLILDEADRMLDMGFMPEIQKMVEDPNMPKKVRYVRHGLAKVVKSAIQSLNLTLDHLSLLRYLKVFFCPY